ncbi:MAG: methyltransferase [Oscillospiraceae bacterium]|jgi:16S rRNA (guanine1207-N2)-methyltransferase|nr:methyltransferase [Oscillospiraceae bacterium]
MSHYFIEDSGLAPDERHFAYYAGSTRLTFVSDAGLFSHGHMDGASTLLLHAMLRDKLFLSCASAGGSLLDLGCGWGAIGVTLGKIFPQLHISFADVNPKALRLAKQNASTNGVAGAYILSNAFENISGIFDCAALNPPIHAGKDICRAMLLGCAEHLSPGGTLYAVMRKKHGAISILSELSAQYTVEIICKEKGILVFRLYVN